MKGRRFRGIRTEGLNGRKRVGGMTTVVTVILQRVFRRVERRERGERMTAVVAAILHRVFRRVERRERGERMQRG